MFWTLLNAITDGFMNLGEYVWDLFSATGGIATIITLSVIGMFISFVVLNRTGVLAKAGRSDKVKRKRSDE